ncbi:lytic transglycosylase domain-containing protein [Methylocaldum szegediense]|nr:lytic transglycosylase domain-containing protein [Methylocaldum szegediense]
MKPGITFCTWMTFAVLAVFFAGSADADNVPLGYRYPDEAPKQVDSPFAEPPGLQDAVQFWRQVFGVWRLNQFALHDNVHLGVVYDVIKLPDVDGNGLTPEQKSSVEWYVNALKDELQELEERVRFGAPLSDSQQRLFDLLVAHAGEGAIYGASQRVRSQRGLRERFLRGLEISGRYDRLFRRIFREAHLPEDLALLPHVESSFVNHAQSTAGAVGMWQFMRSTARRCLHLSRAVDERFDPVFAARGAARYLAHAYDVLGDWGLAITSYNHGIGGMVRASREFGPDLGRIVRYYQGPAFGFASRNFYAEFLAVRSIIQNLPDYFPEGVSFEPPLRHDLLRLTRPVSVTHLATAHGVERDTLAALNPAWTTTAIKGHTLLPAGIDVWLPRGTLASASGFSDYGEPVLMAGGDLLPDQTPQASETDGRIITAGLSDFTEESVSVRPRLLVAPAPVPPSDIVRTSAHRKTAAKTANSGLKAKSKQSPKQAIRIHTVRRGESPRVIAAKYGVGLRKLLTINAITKRTVLRPGQKLRIPLSSS